jgi:nucleotide-binding universal stress UspA family protein
MAQRFPVLVATDGSAQARAAVEIAIAFPWPRSSTGHGIVARATPVLTEATPALREALLEARRAEARRAEHRLRRRWPNAEVVVTDAPPVPGILKQARRLGAQAIVLGSRGLGGVARLVLGSVSRAIVRQASGAVLVVRGPARTPRRFLVGVDGSPHARRALAFVARLTPPTAGHVRLLSVVEAGRLPSMALLPQRVRAVIAGEAANLERERVAAARRLLEATRARLARAGWRVRIDVRAGQPLEELLAAASDTDVLVVGARGVGGVERLLIGSVAEGAVSRAPTPVLVVR